ncbi:uncharacterized protein [Rutidosis leptorrhynchoides]|uniref:uncharacterized protein n=1 Tax=Rutidosis leptorrhynchoides TaxID=125765 RepID=UPI003A994029
MSTYKKNESDSDDESTTNDKEKKKGAKILPYFLLIPRLQRLYMSPESDVAIIWHEDSRTKDGFMRHPADSPAWKTIDHTYPNFARELRNVRLRLASDGFNPFRNMNVSHSNDIDVYLQPLIEELKELWETGVETYDASIKNTFNMRASLLWIINAFPVYTNLSGWSTKGKYACPKKMVCDSVLGTLLNLDGKTKDHLKSRRDLQEMKIRAELHPAPLPNGKVYMPPTYFTMDKKEKELFCEILMGVKVPDGYSANISRCVQQKPPKLSGLKSHDKHFDAASASSYFHLATEAKQGGPVHYRWMYPTERYLGTLKSYVRHKAKPKGSIAKVYLAEECLAFCSLYLSSDVERIHNKKSRNYDDGGKEDVLPIFSMPGRPIGATVATRLDLETLDKAHSYVLFNCKNICKFYVIRIENFVSSSWSACTVTHLDKIGDNIITDDLRHLANGPCEFVKTYKGFIVNGYRFHIKVVEKKRKTQNSGVILEALTRSFSSTRNNNTVTGDVTYYGVIKEIIELQYSVENKIVLFLCDWISNGSRKKVDENGFTLLNFVGVKPDKEPYILASQAQQVFYVKDRVHKGWKVIIKTTPRDSYDMDEQTNVDVKMLLQSATSTGPDKDVDVDIEMVRRDLEGTVVENTTLQIETLDENFAEEAS